MKQEPRFKKQEPGNIRGICVNCLKNPQLRKDKNRYSSLCNTCSTLFYRNSDKVRAVNLRAVKKRCPYRAHKKEHCEQCGFVPIHMCQLDVDHIDGYHLNNEVTNLQTLCANCHRLKSFLNKESGRKRKDTSNISNKIL
jgi:hypothetical protein